MPRQYNDPAGGTPSDVGTQFRTDHYVKKALIEARELQYFMPLADVTSMPKNMGKKIKKYHYIPLLDDENINDQGLDAAGAVIAAGWEVLFTAARTTIDFPVEADADLFITEYGSGSKSGAGPFTVTFTSTESVTVTTASLAETIHGITGGVLVSTGGNLYGSSKDIGAIPGKLPTLTENGGRVNRVGFRRKQVEGTIEKFGFFDEYSQESVDFDTDADLRMHVSREMLNGATELTEDALQIDLVNGAGVIRYAGTAASDGDIDNTSVVDYSDLLALHITLNDNRTPMKTKVITGTRMVDTKTVAGGRVLYCGSELQPVLEAMTDLHGNPAFTPVHQYAAGTTVLNGEIGAVSYFRIVIVPKMLHWGNAGAATPAAGFYGDTNYDVFPMLCVGDESFTTIGFQTDGKTVKFKIYHKPPGEENADRNDPYGENGFMSIKWYYGILLQRPERLGLIKTAAQMA